MYMYYSSKRTVSVQIFKQHVFFWIAYDADSKTDFRGFP